MSPSTRRSPSKRSATTKRATTKRSTAKRTTTRATTKRTATKRTATKRTAARRTPATRAAARPPVLASLADGAPAPARAAGLPGSAPPVAFDVSVRVPGGAQVIGVGVRAGARSVRAPAGVSGVSLSPAYLALRGFEGKKGQTTVVPGAGRKVVVVVGTGAGDAEALRSAAAAVVRAAGRATHVAFAPGAAGDGVSAASAAQAVAEGATLAAYRYTTFKSAKADGAQPRLERFTLVGTADGTDAGLKRGAVVAGAVALARDLVNEPAGSLTPTRMAAIAEQLASRSGLRLAVYDGTAILRERLGALAGVARGSDEEARLVRLAYAPSGAAPRAGARSGSGTGAVPTIAIVGKGITFDSGGLSLKTPDGMTTMKTDMSGAAAVLATMSVLAELDVPVRVIGYMPLTENMPGGRAIKPGDVLRARNGKTIEVLNTDAEGRLVLADALSLATEDKPDAIVDLATLTGAVVIALGRKIAGVMGNDDELLGRLEAAGERAGERLWRLPLPDDYRRDIDSEVADMKNIGAAGAAGSIIGGVFLREFVGDVPWAHMDIAGTARADADDGYTTRGATGFGVRTLVEMLDSFGPGG
ncbi:MAG TPA: leucyl aminopeptidase [Acidimicrobiales bacterium]|nr:leucyl aminopeptidase [Acidimicrobiales bacterium]